MVTSTGLAAAVTPFHTVVRRETDRLPLLVRAVGVGDTAASAALGPWAFDLSEALHHYLRAHEAYLRPALLSRRADDRRAWDTMAAAGRDQREVERALSVVQGAAIRWQDGAGTTDRDALAAGIELLRPRAERALRRIEDEVAPLADEHVTPDVRDRIAAHPVRALGGARGRAVLGAMIATLEQPADATWLAGGPGPVPALRRWRARRTHARRTAAFAPVSRSRGRGPAG